MRQRGVEMLVGQIRTHRDRIGPLNKVLRGRSADRTEFSIEEMSEVANIQTFMARPERDVLRVKGVFLGLLDHWLLADPGPAESIGRLECDQA